MRKILGLSFLVFFFLILFPKSIFAQCVPCPPEGGSCINQECCDPCVEVRSTTGQTAACHCYLPTPTPPPPATCASCPGGLCLNLPCCENCVCVESRNTGQKTCQVPTATPTPKGTTRVGCNGICTSSGDCTADPKCTECRFNRFTRTNICVDPENPPDGTSEQPVEGGPIQTAIGEIDPRNLQGFVQQLLSLALGVAGGIAFLLMIFGAFQIMTSSGNPEKMKSGSELITSALTGLLFIIFSIFLLKFIGVKILEIPGFGQ